jgi:hypothetical protein
MALVRRTYRGQLSSARVSPEGFLLFEGIATRAGVFPYVQPDGSIRREYRSPEQVTAEASLDTLRRKPVTLNHPTDAQGKRILVTPDNARTHVSGALTDDVEICDTVSFAPGDEPGPYIKASGIVYDMDALRNVVLADERALSCGYTCEVELLPGVTPHGEPYDAVQRNISYNHLAIVPKGRAGEVALLRLDAAGDELYINPTPQPTPAPAPAAAPAPQERHVKIKLKDNICVEIKDDASPEAIDAISELKADAAKVASLKSDMEKMQGQYDAMKADMDKMKPAMDEAKTKMDAMKSMLADFMEEQMDMDDGDEKEEFLEAIMKGDAAVKTKIAARMKLRADALASRAAERVKLSQIATEQGVQHGDSTTLEELRRALASHLTGIELKADASTAKVEGMLEVALASLSQQQPASSGSTQQLASQVLAGRAPATAQTQQQRADAALNPRERYLANLKSQRPS